jgi:hypothetical protein
MTPTMILTLILIRLQRTAALTTMHPKINPTMTVTTAETTRIPNPTFLK